MFRVANPTLVKRSKKYPVFAKCPTKLNILSINGTYVFHGAILHLIPKTLLDVLNKFLNDIMLCLRKQIFLFLSILETIMHFGVLLLRSFGVLPLISLVVLLVLCFTGGDKAFFIGLNDPHG